MIEMIFVFNDIVGGDGIFLSLAANVVHFMNTFGN